MQLSKVTKKYLRWNIVVSAIFSALFVGILIFNNYHYDNQYNMLLSQELKETQNGYKISLAGYKRIAHCVFNEKINNPVVIKILYKARHTSDLKVRAELRESLKQVMSNTYKGILGWDFRQLQFHLPDNTSFLRMHRPEKFGDDLTAFRETVRLVNATQKYSEGFEEGRIYNGYRFVFPLHHKSDHVGSVEISISLAACGNSLKELYNNNYQFLLNEQLVRKKVFQDELRNYTPSVLSDLYVVDKGTDQAPCLAGFLNDEKFTDFKEKVAEKIALKKDFIELFRFDNNFYLIKFLAIHNFQNQVVGYMVFINESLLFETIHFLKVKMVTIFTGSFIVLMVFLQLFFYFKKRSVELKNFVPICSSCKKIRKPGTDPKDVNSWMSLERYFASRTITSLSHSYCPTCLEKLKDEIDEDS